MRVALIVATIAFCLIGMCAGARVPVSLAYDPELAAAMAEYSAASYCERHELEPWDCKACTGGTTGFVLTKYFYDSTTSTNAFTGYHSDSKAIILAFEGTANSTNWVIDAEAWKTDFEYPGAPSGAKVHHGFWKAFSTISDDVQADVTALVNQFPDYNVYVTGHSLGAALALFGALEIAVKAEPDVPVTLYSFGSPRIGNKEFAQWAESQLHSLYRVVNNSDIVPHLPSHLPPFDFWHSGDEAWYHKGTYNVCEPEDPKCSDSVLPIFWNWKDHHEYLGSIMGGGSC